ncbi:nutritionally-regulated adipose and cardiac enriched protein homolog [Zootoca vivipara]|uniref:nutritionally-regulated adipose and cardiac enriched protein homolog n=1 Tax=Zootoca vivipara TaxID=8524 RepID=UPI00293B875F|nr:nutritionally-regulated adipose and cardiac enriched protein homolog [Zootoca vivipara]
MHCEGKTHYTKSPPSILRKRSSVNKALSQKQKVGRRVRFQEPEEIIGHGGGSCDYIVAHKRPASVLPLFLGIFLCALLLLALSLYYGSVRRDFKVLEEFHTQLVIAVLQIRHVAVKCWAWFMRL